MQHSAAVQGRLQTDAAELAQPAERLGSTDLGLIENAAGERLKPAFEQAGYFLDERGAYGEAGPLLKCALDLLEERLDPDHVGPLLHHLVALYFVPGRQSSP